MHFGEENARGPKIIPTLSRNICEWAFKIFVSGSIRILALDSNRVARTSRVFKTGIECELIISVETRSFENHLTKNALAWMAKKELFESADVKTAL